MPRAQRFIHLQYFIWEQDRLTAEIVPILLDRLAAGVEVRIMYDWMGCISFKKRELKQLAEGRSQCARRRHRPGARQLPQPPQDRRHRRRDRVHRRHERRSGVHRRRRAVRHLARHSPAPHRPSRGRRSRSCTHHAGSSARRTTRTCSTSEYMPAPDPTAVETGTLVEIAAQGVEDPWSAARRAHMVAIGQAEESVWIQSPYFIPDYSVYDVMINAALSGIDVRFMMTGVPDKHTRLLRGADLLPQAHRGRRHGVPVQGRLLTQQDDRRRRRHQRRRHDEHGPAQPQASQGAHGLGVRPRLRPAVRRRFHRRHRGLPPGHPRRRAPRYAA